MHFCPVWSSWIGLEDVWKCGEFFVSEEESVLGIRFGEHGEFFIWVFGFAIVADENGKITFELFVKGSFLI